MKPGQAQKIYEDLQKAGDNNYKVLAHLFRVVFNRNLKNTEWGFLRKLINLYGDELVYWAMINSIGISNTNRPLRYVRGVCNGLLKEQAEEVQVDVIISSDVDELLEYMREYQRPDWSTILEDKNATGEAP